MTFPTVVSVQRFFNSANSLNNALSLPASPAVGNVLLLFLANDGTTALQAVAGDGWSRLFTATNSDRLSVWWHRVQSGRDHAANSITNTTEAVAHHCYEIADCDPTRIYWPTTSTGTGSSSEIPVPSLTISGAADDTLWIAACAQNSSGISTVPGSFGSGIWDGGSATANAAIASATRSVNASSLSPSNWVMTGSGTPFYISTLLGIRAPVAGPPPEGGLGFPLSRLINT